MYLVTSDPIDVHQAEALLRDPKAGGIVTFSGVVRDHNEGRDVLHLAYEAYPEMAQAQLADIGKQILERWDAKRVVLIHRIGRLEIGEVAVFVGVSAPHRGAAFEACRHGIDTIKRDVPIWKKEHFAGGATWLEGCSHQE